MVKGILRHIVVGVIPLVLIRFIVLPRCSLAFIGFVSFSFYPPQPRGIVPFYQNKSSKARGASFFMPRCRGSQLTSAGGRFRKSRVGRSRTTKTTKFLPAHAPPVLVADLIRAATHRLQDEAAQAAAQAAAHAAAQDAAPQRVQERAECVEAAAAVVNARARLRRTPQRVRHVAKMSTGSVRKN